MTLFQTFLILTGTLNFASLFFIPTLIAIDHPLKPYKPFGLACFNPAVWVKMLNFNWIGAIIIILFLGILWWPYALCYWSYKLFTWHPKKR